MLTYCFCIMHNDWLYYQKISGETVIDASGDPLIGVNVSVKGTNDRYYN